MSRPADRPAAPPVGVSDRYLLPYLLHRASGLFEQQWRAEQGGRGATIHRWQVLSILQALDGSRVGQIAEMAGVSQPVLSRVVDQMERDGLVERRPDPDDRRSVGVWTTAEGRRTFTELLPRAAALVDRALQGLDDEEVATLHGLLVRVLAGLESEGDRP